MTSAIKKFAGPATNIKEYSARNPAGFWSSVCKDLQVPNTLTNRQKIVQAFLLQFKDGHLSPCRKEELECPSFNLDVQDTKADSDVDSSPVTDISESTCASTPDKDIDNNKSPCISTQSSEEEMRFFTCSLPRQPCFFFIERKAWQELRQHQEGRLFQGLQWTNVIANGIKSIHPYCSFAFKRHRVKTLGSQTQAPFFTCEGYCCFEHCPVEVKVEVADESSLKAAVDFSGGDVCHNSKDLQRRPVRAAARQATAEVLETKLPRSLYLESMQKIPPMVIDSGCRDDAPTANVLKNILWSEKKKARSHPDELPSLKALIDKQRGTDNDVLQKVMMHPKGVMLWSNKTLSVFYKRCKNDIVYLDATGSVIKKNSAESPPYYVYELVVRNPSRGASPLPVATYVTCDHTTASVTYFLQAFQTDVIRMYGNVAIKRPVMIICDGSLVLMQSISITFCRTGLEDLLQKYFLLITGQHPTETFDLPILHRCLSHIMKNAKALCKKQIPKHYTLAMHIFGLLACCSSLKEMDEVLSSSTVLFCSPCSGANVAKHYNNLHLLMQQRGTLELDDKNVAAEEYKHDVGNIPIMEHFRTTINSAPLDLDGDPNIYYTPEFIGSLAKYFLPHAVLWSGLMLGDLGRHGTSPAYQNLSKVYSKVKQSKEQNFTEDNRTQGIMEKSQWDLKQIRLQRKRFSRLDDFVRIYQKMHDALLLEYGDMERCRKKSFPVEEEVWRKKKKVKGLYVSPLLLDLSLKKEDTKERTTQRTNDDSSQATCNFREHQQDDTKERSTQRTDDDSSRATFDFTEHQQDDTKDCTTQRTNDAASRLSALWKQKDTVVVVSVVPSQFRKDLLVRHTDLLSLRPHNWLTGEVIECFLHHTVNQLHLEKTIYVMNFYSATAVLYADRTTVRKHSLSEVNFANYKAIVSFVSFEKTHWKFLYINATENIVYLLDPLSNPAEEADSKAAAQKFREYFKIRTICHLMREWADIKFEGAVMDHPLQQDGSSCGVIVIKMAKAVIEAFPKLPKMEFGTTLKEMAQERTALALEILQASDSVRQL
ncbi:uncharacterized protein [Garra rufa]